MTGVLRDLPYVSTSAEHIQERTLSGTSRQVRVLWKSRGMQMNRWPDFVRHKFDDGLATRVLQTERPKVTWATAWLVGLTHKDHPPILPMLRYIGCGPHTTDRFMNDGRHTLCCRTPRSSWSKVLGDRFAKRSPLERPNNLLCSRRGACLLQRMHPGLIISTEDGMKMCFQTLNLFPTRENFSLRTVDLDMLERLLRRKLTNDSVEFVCVILLSVLLSLMQVIVKALPARNP